MDDYYIKLSKYIECSKIVKLCQCDCCCDDCEYNIKLKDIFIFDNMDIIDNF